MLKDSGSSRSESSATGPGRGRRRRKAVKRGGTVRLTEPVAELLAIRRRLKLPAKAFAAAIGVSATTLANWQRRGKTSKAALITARGLATPSPSAPQSQLFIVMRLAEGKMDIAKLADFRTIVLDNVTYRLVPELTEEAPCR